jgi:hypothetical protein
VPQAAGFQAFYKNRYINPLQKYVELGFSELGASRLINHNNCERFNRRRSL